MVLLVVDLETMSCATDILFMAREFRSRLVLRFMPADKAKSNAGINEYQPSPWGTLVVVIVVDPTWIDAAQLTRHWSIRIF